MPNEAHVNDPDDKSLRRFVESIPDADTIRKRLDTNSSETKLLRRMLRLACDRDELMPATEASREATRHE